MQLRSIGFLPVLVTVCVGSLFALKYHRDSDEKEYAMKLQVLIDESSYDDGMTSWEIRQKNYLTALALMSKAQDEKVDVERLVEKAVNGLGAPEPYKRVLADSLLLNLRIVDELELITEENLARLDRGEPMKIGTGGFAGDVVVLGNIIPYQFSPELETLFANLLLKPQGEAREYPRKVGAGAESLLSACRSAEMMTEEGYVRAMRSLGRS